MQILLILNKKSGWWANRQMFSATCYSFNTYFVPQFFRLTSLMLNKTKTFCTQPSQLQRVKLQISIRTILYKRSQQSSKHKYGKEIEVFIQTKRVRRVKVGAFIRSRIRRLRRRSLINKVVLFVHGVTRTLTHQKRRYRKNS